MRLARQAGVGDGGVQQAQGFVSAAAVHHAVQVVAPAFGALIGGLCIGLVEALAGAYLGGEYKLLATFIVLVGILMVRPYGLFGTHEIERL